MMKLKLSEHIINDRQNRAVAIAMAVGIGEIVLSIPDKNPNRTASLTSTGVILITADNGIVVTMYLATYEQIDKMYHVAEKEIPKTIKKVVENNIKKHREIFKMRDQGLDKSLKTQYNKDKERARKPKRKELIL